MWFIAGDGPVAYCWCRTGIEKVSINSSGNSLQIGLQNWTRGNRDRVLPTRMAFGERRCMVMCSPAVASRRMNKALSKRAVERETGIARIFWTNLDLRLITKNKDKY
ncbi:hypothetical protein GN956_G4436 [Arapaima gigas]